jgi:hypothetical protein
VRDSSGRGVGSGSDLACREPGGKIEIAGTGLVRRDLTSDIRPAIIVSQKLDRLDKLWWVKRGPLVSSQTNDASTGRQSTGKDT